MSYFLIPKKAALPNVVRRYHSSLYKRFVEIKQHLIDLINIIDSLFHKILYDQVAFSGMRQGIPCLSQKLLQFREGGVPGQSPERAPLPERVDNPHGTES